ncbi:MAG: Mrp/NBP35 family ATP-binding protein [Clostridiaceae bacterium]|nr:Mrp/NBP35 family ATP-binding protein [Clostridiaceae bacterium]
MSQDCDNNCAGCAQDCDDRTEEQIDFTAHLHPESSVKKLIAVMSGKGGVGKSLVASLLAVGMMKKGYRVAVLDADVTGPSIPKSFGLRGKATGSRSGIFPVQSKGGIEIMSLNLLLENDTDPVVWRGPIIGGTVKQFWTDVIWQDVDYMFIDMPPGTGDVPLTIYQSLPVDGVVVVTSPQELVSMVVTKSVKMAEMMKIPVVGVVENMSYFKAPDTGTEYKIFGESHIEETAARLGLEVLARIPIDPELSAIVDRGEIESVDPVWLEGLLKAIE